MRAFIVLLLLGLAAPGITRAQPADCIALIGDSVAYGEATFMVPGQGFITTRTEPLSAALARELDGITVRDRTVPASYLNWFSELTYFQTPEYESLLADGCAVNVVMPWYNDFALLERGGGAAEYIPWLGYLIYSMKAVNPQARFILLDFFPVYPADFTSDVYGYITPQTIDSYNRALAFACQPDGPLGAIDGVSCHSTAGLFDDLNRTHVITTVTQQAFDELRMGALSPQEQTLLDFYWQQNPDGTLTGDGVHLTPLGQQVLTQFISLIAQPG